VRSVLLGIDGETTLSHISSAQAVAQLRVWLKAYAQAWRAPLPVALRTGLAYLQALHTAEGKSEKSGSDPDNSEKSGSDPDNSQGDTEGDESLAEVALSQAELAFEGSFATEGEWGRSPYLQRSFESFDDIAKSLPQWADALYGGLLTHVQLTHAQGPEKERSQESGDSA
jgi:exonuclease V gamma subunit